MRWKTLGVFIFGLVVAGGLYFSSYAEQTATATQAVNGEKSLFITEIMYDSISTDAEYVEISNLGDTAIDISGYYIGDAATRGSSEGMFRFPQGTMIGPGQSIVVAQSAILTRERHQFTPDFELPYHPTYNPQDDPNVPNMLDSDWSSGYLSLAQGGDDVLLMDQNQEVVDYVPYIVDRTLRGKLYRAAPGMTQHIQSLQRQFVTGDASVDFWPLPPTPGYYQLRDGDPTPFSGPVISHTLLITEVLYNAIHDEDSGEFIEFTNISDQPIDISGYSIGDSEWPKFTSSGEGMFKFPEGTVIQPYQVVVVATNALGLKQRYGVVADFEIDDSLPESVTLEPNSAWSTGLIRLANAGDQALIYDRDMQIVDAVVWETSAPFPGVTPFTRTIFSNNGHSIERLNGIDTNNSANDYIDQPNPSPGVLLFGPNADPSRIPDRSFRNDILVPNEPDTGIVVPPTVVGMGGDAANAPENTFAAIDRLLETDASQILLPVQETADGELIVMKDRTLNRTTNGHGRVDNTTWSEIRELDAGSWFSPEFAGERVPLLSEALDRIRGRLLPVIQAETSDTAVKALRLLEQKNMTDAAIVSTDPQVIAEVRALNPEVRGGIMFPNNPLNQEHLKRIVLTSRNNGARIALLDDKKLTAEAVHDLRVRGIAVWAFGAQDPTEANKLISFGVDGIVSENPLAVVDALEQYPQNSIAIRPIIGGHRGSLEGVPENTMLAFETAWNAGVDFIETDVLETKDGHLVLMHDDNVDRTTDGTGKVRNMTLAEIKRLNANYVDPQNPVEVPTLEEFLIWAKSKKAERDLALFLEIKAPGIEQKIIDLVTKHGLEQDVFVISFRLEELKNVRRLNREIGLVYIHDGVLPTENPLGHAEKFGRESVMNDVQFNPTVSMTPELLNYGKHRGLITIAWPLADVSDNPNEYANVPVSIEVPQSISLSVGETTSLEGIWVDRTGTEHSASLLIRALSPQSVVSVARDGQSMTGLQKGTTWVQAYQRFTFSGEEWTVYSQPIQVTVK